jgi:PAS domain S-box-containing protein
MLTRAEIPESDTQRRSRNELPYDSLFQTHFDNLPGPAYIWKRSGNDFVLHAYNRAAGALSFSKVADYVGTTVRELQPKVAFDLLADLDTSASKGVVVTREVDHLYVGTTAVRRLVLSFVPVSDEMVVVHTDDVTERRRMEVALRESESQYRTIVDTSHEGIWAVDDESRTTYVNRRAAEMLGYEPEEMLGRSVFDFMDEALHEEGRRIRERRRAGVKEQFDFRLRHRDGSDVWVSVAASPIVDRAGTAMGAIHMIADVTARRRAEHALRESEMRVRALLDAHPDLILRLTRDGRYLDLHCTDKRLASFLPCSPDQFIGKNVRDLFDPAFAHQHERLRRRALATGEVQRWEYVRHVNGADLYLEARFVKSGDDEVVVTVRDITHRVELEREVIASSERERTRIGHDLHDGLAQLLIGVKLLLETLTDKLAVGGSPHRDDARRAAQLVTRAISQTSELAQGLSPIRKGGRLCDALKHLATQSELLLGIQCSIVSVELPPALDQNAATHVYRIVQEAITNAVKHGKSAAVEVACKRQKQQLVITISDNGLGIAEGASDGGGMGTHIMRYRARSIGGDLTIAARPEGGTVVTCVWPWRAATPTAVKSRAAKPA